MKRILLGMVLASASTAQLSQPEIAGLAKVLDAIYATRDPVVERIQWEVLCHGVRVRILATKPERRSEVERILVKACEAQGLVK